jgi:hypothetical protein
VQIVERKILAGQENSGTPKTLLDFASQSLRFRSTQNRPNRPSAMSKNARATSDFRGRRDPHRGLRHIRRGLRRHPSVPSVGALR